MKAIKILIFVFAVMSCFEIVHAEDVKIPADNDISENKMDDAEYSLRFDENGMLCYSKNENDFMKSIFIEFDGETYYFDDNGYAVSGYKIIKNYLYYFDNEYKLITNVEKNLKNGEKIYFNELGIGVIKNINDYNFLVYIKELDQLLYFENGKIVHNKLCFIEGKYYYFGNEGYAVHGLYDYGSYHYFFDNKSKEMVTDCELIIDGKEYTFDEKGKGLTNEVIKSTRNSNIRYTNESLNGFLNNNGFTYYYVNGQMVHWVQEINGNSYYFNERGEMFTGGFLKYNEDGQYRYYKKDGVRAENEFITENGKIYYFDVKGQMVHWVQEINGNSYYFNERGEMFTGGFLKYNEDGQYRYYKKDGVRAENEFITENGKIYYFDEKGQMAYWVREINGSSYYFNERGEMFTGGWLKFNQDNELRYYKKDGKQAKNEFVTYNNNVYYLNKDGIMSKWDTIIDGKRYYFFGDGIMYNGGWLKYNDTIYRYFCKSGYMLKNTWIEEGINVRYVDNEGLRVINRILNIDGIEYDFNEDGLTSFWMEKDGFVYYVNKGVMAKGWQIIDDKKYYFNSKGERIGNGPLKKVIDVSEHDGIIDWEKVKKDGQIDSVILRIGFGNVREDLQLKRNIAELNRLNIPFDLYLYSYAENEDEALWEAQFVVNILRKYNIGKNTHIYYDIEKPQYLDGRDIKITPTQYLKIIPTFLEYLSLSGYEKNSVYTYRAYLTDKSSGFGGILELIQYVDWIAEYGDHVYYDNKHAETDFSGWQYTSEGFIPGIKGNTDISIFF